MKRILSLILAITLTMSIIVVGTVEASGNIIDSDYCGIGNNAGGIESVWWTLDSNGLLTISGNGEMVRNWYKNTSQIRGWHEYSSLIKTVVIEEGVTNIGSYSFENCVNLQAIYIPKSVTETHGDALGNIKNQVKLNVYYAGSSKEFKSIGGYNAISVGDYYFNTTYQSTSDIIKVKLNGIELSFDQPPVMIDDRVMVPIRSIAEAMGNKVKWSDKLNSALVKCPDRAAMFKIDSERASIAYSSDFREWKYYNSDVSPQVINDRTLVPVRMFGECLGAEIEWDDTSNTVYINYTRPDDTLSSSVVSEINAYYSSLLSNSDFSTNYTDAINEFYNSRDKTWDGFIIFWDDWWIAAKTALSGETNYVYMLKNSLAEIFSELPLAGELSVETEAEIMKRITSSASNLKYLKLSNIKKDGLTDNTVKALNNLGTELDNAGVLIDLSVIGMDAICKILSDYVNSEIYLETMRDSFKNANINDEDFYKALDALESEYTDKYVETLKSALADLKLSSGQYLLGEITGGAFSLAELSKDILNAAVGNDKKADAVIQINCIYSYNYALDKSYNKIRSSVMSNPENIQEYILMFELQKAVKHKMFESMDKLKDKNDEYTKTYIQNCLSEIENATYIIFK